MPGKFDRYAADLKQLIAKGDQLVLSMNAACYPEEAQKALAKKYGAKATSVLAALPVFEDAYQLWYSEAKALLRQLLPDRLDDFVRHYEKPKTRKELTAENYRIEDYLQGLAVVQGWQKEKVVGPSAAISHFRQQLAIVKSAQSRFESTLFDIQQLVQGDIFDSELDASRELLRKKFPRAAGALAGVVLERHLQQVCLSRGIKLRKKSPGIADLNDALKETQAIDVVQWRFIQRLADIRNLCDHSKNAEPTAEQVEDLVDGAAKITKTVF